MHGSIEKRVGKRGVAWRVRYDVSRPDGSRKQVSETVPTKREAEALLARRLHELSTGAYVTPTVLTVADLLDQWFAAHATRVRPATIHRYRRAADAHLVREFGALPLARLSPLVIQDLYRRLQRDGLGPEGVRMVHKVLHGALKQAVAWRLLPANPADGVAVPQPVRRELEVWNADQAAAFLAAVDDDPRWGALFLVAIHTGMRRGELLALRWEDIDLERGLVTIRRTMTEDVNGHDVIGPAPKTRAGRRPIALAASCVDRLRKHRAQQAERRLLLGPAWDTTAGDLVFDRGDGRLIHVDSPGDALDRLAERRGLPRMRFHDLRHTMATVGLVEGVHPKVIQERLGHSSIAMTLDRYSHVSAELQRAGAERLDAALGRSKQTGRDQAVTEEAETG